MKQNSNQIGPLLQNFFVDYLCTQKRSSSQTIASYRDTFRLLLEFIHKQHGIEPAIACVSDLDVPVILSFLDHLEQSRHNSIRSRNLRLTAIRSFFQEPPPHQTTLAFPSARGQKLTRNGVDYILQQAVDRARAECSSLREKKVTPHSVRHTTAAHLLQSGVDISVIALWLGHESIETTHIYLEADLATKERALSKLAPAGGELPRFKAKDEVLAFLATL